MRLLLLFCAFVGAPAFAQDKQATPAPVMPATVGPKVEVEVLLVHATRGEPAVDPRLTPLLHQFKSMPFTRFALLDQHEATLVDGGDDAVEMDGSRKLRLALISHDDVGAQVRVQLMTGDTQVLDTTVSIHRNKMFSLALNGYKGGALIIPVGVRY
jgi:hypothetical protein